MPTLIENYELQIGNYADCRFPHKFLWKEISRFVIKNGIWITDLTLIQKLKTFTWWKLGQSFYLLFSKGGKGWLGMRNTGMASFRGKKRGPGCTLDNWKALLPLFPEQYNWESYPVVFKNNTHPIVTEGTVSWDNVLFVPLFSISCCKVITLEKTKFSTLIIYPVGFYHQHTRPRAGAPCSSF